MQLGLKRVKKQQREKEDKKLQKLTRAYKSSTFVNAIV